MVETKNPYSSVTQTYGFTPTARTPYNTSSSSGGGGNSPVVSGGSTSGSGGGVRTPSSSGSSGQPYQSTTERDALMKSQGYTVVNGQWVKPAERGEGTIEAPLQNQLGAAYIIRGAQQANILNQDGSFTAGASQTQKDVIIKDLRQEGFLVRERGGQIVNMGAGGVVAQQSSSQQSSQATPSNGGSNQFGLSGRVDPFSSMKDKPAQQVQQEYMTRGQPAAIAQPSQPVQWYDIAGSFARDMISSPIANPAMFIQSLPTRAVEAGKVLERTKEYEKLNPLLGIASVALGSPSVMFPETTKTGDRLYSQIGEKRTELQSSGIPFSDVLSIGGYGAYYGIDTFFTVSMAGNTAKSAVISGKIIQAEGVKGAARVGSEFIGGVVDVYGSPTKIVTGLTKITPEHAQLIQRGVGSVVIGAAAADVTGLYKNEFGEGVTAKTVDFGKYMTGTLEGEKRADIVASATVWNMPYYGARVAQSYLPSGKISAGLEFLYKGANIGATGLITYGNIKQAEAEGKGWQYGVGTAWTELGVFENYFEGQTIDKAFEGSRFYQAGQARAGVDLASGVKKPDYYSMWSSITPDQGGSIPSFRIGQEYYTDFSQVMGAKTDYKPEPSRTEIKPQDFKTDYDNKIKPFDYRGYDIKPLDYRANEIKPVDNGRKFRGWDITIKEEWVFPPDPVKPDPTPKDVKPFKPDDDVKPNDPTIKPNDFKMDSVPFVPIFPGFGSGNGAGGSTGKFKLKSFKGSSYSLPEIAMSYDTKGWFKKRGRK